jgi:hypothetical protein
MIDAIEERRKDARRAAWAGILIAILGVLSWNTYGFLVCSIAAMVFGLYAYRWAPREALADFVVGGMLLVVLALRLGGII